jgi:hypothetical protein
MMSVSWDLEAGRPDGAAVIKVLDEDGVIHMARVVTDRAEIEAILKGLGVRASGRPPSRSRKSTRGAAS